MVESSTKMVSLLPAKKRIGIQYLHPPATTCCLPAKKRVWAPPPFIEPQEEETHKRLRKSEESDEDEESAEGEDGIVCVVCNSTDGDSVDPIVFCDGCDLMVHASCYGNPLVKSIPEGDWFCTVCQSKSEELNLDVVECCLCPVKTGAMKPTTDGKWAHILCSLLVAEVFFQDPLGREGVDLSKVPMHRWKGSCFLCGSSCGCVVECSEPKCKLKFHATCGLEKDLCVEYREEKSGNVILGFCEDHTKLWRKQQATGKFKIVPRKHHHQHQ
ncbi:hypothetical protein ZOSMA_205G00390 [Zostera marina]|uniref:Protein Jade-1 n=1 Tax=Zostera marina TaxID=29655 RepID=A0A0K9PNQ4_ZOSMR|nr:hypothetical protein ZOSMA_205G00390 [Zostera marina]